MVTSRTGTASHKRWRARVLARDREAGVAVCPMPGCGVPLDYQVGKQPNSAEPDHIIAFANGGTDTLDNGRTICRQCNQRRGNGAQEPKPRPRTTPIIASPGW